MQQRFSFFPNLNFASTFGGADHSTGNNFHVFLWYNMYFKSVADFLDVSCQKLKKKTESNIWLCGTSIHIVVRPIAGGFWVCISASVFGKWPKCKLDSLHAYNQGPVECDWSIPLPIPKPCPVEDRFCIHMQKSVAESLKPHKSDPSCKRRKQQALQNAVTFGNWGQNISKAKQRSEIKSQQKH